MRTDSNRYLPGLAPAAPLAESACAGCGRACMSAHSAAGVCADCDAPICYRCWHNGVRHCRTHMPPALTPKRDKPVTTAETPEAKPRVTWARRTGASCVRCGDELPQSARRRHGPRYCLACQEALAAPPDSLPAGAVDAATASYLEQVFLDRVAPPAGAREVPGFDNVDHGALETHPWADGLRGRLRALPANRAVRARRSWRERRRWTGQRRAFVHAACADRNALLLRGCQHGPAGMALVQQARNALAAHARSGDVLVLFSPTGWQGGIVLPSDTALVRLGNDGRWQVRHALPDTADAASLERLFSGRAPCEESERCRTIIRDVPAAAYPLSAREVSKRHKLSIASVLGAFREAAAQGRWRVCDDPQQQDLLLDLS